MQLTTKNVGKAINIPKILNNPPITTTANIDHKGLTLFVLPYTCGEIKYPSILGKIKQIIKVAINNFEDITLARITAIIFVIHPPKYGITVVNDARSPRSNQLGCPTNQNKNEYSKN